MKLVVSSVGIEERSSRSETTSGRAGAMWTERPR